VPSAVEQEQLASPKSVYEQYIDAGVSKYSPLRNKKHWQKSSSKQQQQQQPPRVQSAHSGYTRIQETPMYRDESMLSPTKKRSVFEQYLERSEAEKTHMRL
jgi:hypothetical protein